VNQPSTKFEDFPALEFADEPAAGEYDAIVVGSGPNGLAAAITLAQADRKVLVCEAAPTIGGGMRTAELTLPGFHHDVCSAIHALGVTSPFFRNNPLTEWGLQWITPPAATAQPLDHDVAMSYQSIEKTAAQFEGDEDAYRRLMQPLADGGEKILAQTLGPFRPPKHPILMTRFGLQAMRSAVGLANRWFKTERAKSLLSGMAAHSILPLEQSFTGAVALMLLITVHRGGWPVARGGSQQIANAMARYLLSLGGEIVVNRRVSCLEELPKSRVVLFDLSPKRVSQIAADALPGRFRKSLEKFRHGPCAFKIDYALSQKIPWKSPQCQEAGTVHVGGTLAEVAESERGPWEDRLSDKPFLLMAQQSHFDDTRAPAGQHTGWAYCHLPHASKIDATQQIESQIERFAPGFRDIVLARHITTPQQFETYNANYIGGDIAGGVMDLPQLFTRPTCRWNPYSTPNRRLFICSASTPPGPGVHGMGGYFAAKSALRVK